MYRQASDMEKFKAQLYAKMREELYNASKNMCYTIANEVQFFVDSNYAEDPDLIKIADNIVVKFLDDLENKLFHFIETYDKELIDIDSA